MKYNNLTLLGLLLLLLFCVLALSVVTRHFGLAGRLGEAIFALIILELAFYLKELKDE